jgi:hypothetical protein
MTRGVFLLSLSMLLAACGSKYFERQDPKDIPEGPGMFSGKEGALAYSTDKKRAEQNASATATRNSPAAIEEFREYQEYQQWQAASKDNAEYREFQDWREWRAYRFGKQGSRR